MRRGLDYSPTLAEKEHFRRQAANAAIVKHDGYSHRWSENKMNLKAKTGNKHIAAAIS